MKLLKFCQKEKEIVKVTYKLRKVNESDLEGFTFIFFMVCG